MPLLVATQFSNNENEIPTFAGRDICGIEYVCSGGSTKYDGHDGIAFFLSHTTTFFVKMSNFVGVSRDFSFWFLHDELHFFF